MPPLDNLPGQLTVPTRDQIAQWYLRDYLIHNPLADIRANSEPWIKAYTYADSALPLYANSVTISKNTARVTMTLDALVNEATALGTQRLPAAGASGAVLVTTSSSGS